MAADIYLITLVATQKENLLLIVIAGIKARMMGKDHDAALTWFL